MKHLFCYLLTFCSLYVFSQHKAEGLNLNEKAPDIKANDQLGKPVDLKVLLSKGPVVLLFYRGQWCPYCSRYLSTVEDSLSLIKAKGATVIAITPEVQENITKTIQKTEASFSIVHDEGLVIMKDYKVAFSVDAATIERYKNYGIDFDVANGEKNGANLPVPAVYIINQAGEIVYKHFDPDYRKRPSIQAILRNL